MRGVRRKWVRVEVGEMEGLHSMQSKYPDEQS